MSSNHEHQRHVCGRSTWPRRLLALVAYMMLGAAMGAGSVVLDATSAHSTTSRQRAQQVLIDGDLDSIWFRAGLGLAIGTAAGLLNVCYGREHRR